MEGDNNEEKKEEIEKTEEEKPVVSTINKRRNTRKNNTPTLGIIAEETNFVHFSRTISAATPATHLLQTSSFLRNIDEEGSIKNERKSRKTNNNSETNTPTIVERVLPEVPEIPSEKLSKLKLLGSSESICVNFNEEWKVIREHLYKEGRIEKEGALHLIRSATEHFKTLPNMLELNAPIAICGDIHGQYYDLCTLLDKIGDPSDSKILFLGDYVDRGDFSCEVCFYLLSLVVSFPENIFMLRGNHESRLITGNFSFKKECYTKYSQEVYDAFMDCFDWLPIAAVISSDQDITRYFCCHGGLSPQLKFFEDINLVKRAVETPAAGLLCDLLWSDPIPEEEGENLDEEDLEYWKDIEFRPNTNRGCSYEFGYKAVSKFLTVNRFTSVIRAHEVKRNGYEENYYCVEDRFIPPIITLFSAPNYCDMYENRGAYMQVSTNGKFRFGQIDWVSHPYWLPEFENAFTFSLTYMIECISRLYIDFLDGFGLESHEAVLLNNLYTKIIVQRKNKEKLLAAKTKFLEGKTDMFMEAIKIDRVNELRPKVKPNARDLKKCSSSVF